MAIASAIAIRRVSCSSDFLRDASTTFG